MNARMNVLAPLSSPDWSPVSESYGMPWENATALVDRLIVETRAAALRQAADLIAPLDHTCGCSDCSELCEKAKILRAKADAILAAVTE